MKNFKLRVKSVDPDDVNICNSIWGEIYAEINDYSFPDNVWYDDVSSVLHMWLGETIDYLTGKQERWELYFMDGPYKIQLKEIPGGNVSVVFIAHDDKEVIRGVVKKSDVIKELLDCTQTFIEECCKKAPNSTTMRSFLETKEMFIKLMGQGDGSVVPAQENEINPS